MLYFLNTPNLRKIALNNIIPEILILTNNELISHKDNQLYKIFDINQEENDEVNDICNGNNPYVYYSSSFKSINQIDTRDIKSSTIIKSMINIFSINFKY